MTEKFAPGIVLKDGTELNTPKGWEWILSFAIHGCEWAVKEVSKPEFREIIIEDLKKTKREELTKSIEEYLIRIESLKEELHVLDQ